MGNFFYKVKIDNEIKIAHYTSCIFPLVPLINDNTYDICNESWKYIINKKIVNNNLSGISMFYNEFYKRLSLIDTNNKIITLIEKNCKGENKITAKGNLIIIIIKFALDKTQHTNAKFKKIKILAKKYNIDPYVYSIFLETLIYTISDNLEYNATHNIMKEWINLFAYILKEFLK
jgi:hemoglobin-like flavoprotein